MGVIAGNDLAIFIERENELALIGYDANCSVRVSAEVVETSSKNSGKWTEKKVGRLSWSLGSEHLYSKESMDALFALLVSRAPVSVAFSVLRKTIYGFTRDDRHRFYGKAFITDLDVTGNIGSAGTLSIKLEGTGELKPFEATSTGVFEYIFENKFE